MEPEQIPFTFEQLRDEVIKLANERPDYIYPAQCDEHNKKCFYIASGDVPACIFGEAMARLGFDVPEWCEGTNIATVLTNLGVSFTSLQETWMRTVQRGQDVGTPWGEAVADANAYVDRIKHA